MSLVKKDKERQLVELALIVTGIRLFNRECGKGGEGIDDSKRYRLLLLLLLLFPSLGWSTTRGSLKSYLVEYL